MPQTKEIIKPFHAKPAPKSTYVAYAPRRKSSQPAGDSLVTPAGKSIRPPRLLTSSRPDRRHAAAEASRKNAEALALEKKQNALRRQKEKHMDDLAKVAGNSPSPVKGPTHPKPFNLVSEQRHESYIHQMEIELKQKEEEEKRKREFHAREINLNFPVSHIQASPRALTEPKPFRLQGEARHIHFQQEMSAKLEQEREIAEDAARFKAKPLPKSTYKAVKPRTPTRPRLTQPFSPDMVLKRRVRERQHYDTCAEKEREEAALQKRLAEERQREEEELELKERRNLPVSEGGMIPIAAPINAVLMSEGI